MPGRRYAVVGTGALGGYYGGLLARAGFEVHFLLRSDFGHVRKHGLSVTSPNGDFVLPEVHAHGTPETVPPVDVVIVALKTTANESLSAVMPRLSEDGVALVLQNGLDPEAATAAVVGAGRTLGGCSFLCSDKPGPGRIAHIDYGKITFGEYAAVGVTDRVRAIAGDLRGAGIEAETVADLRLARWKKLVWNVPFNGLSVVLEATTAEILADPDAAALAEDLMHEVVAAAAGHGKVIEPDFVPTMLAHTRKMRPYDSSMRVDDKRGRPLEVEAMYHAVVAAADEVGVPVPRIAMLATQLEFRDSRRRRGDKTQPSESATSAR